MIRILIVEDSLVEKELLIHILDSDPQIEVIGVAADGEKAILAAKQLQPDLITMDIHMPRMNGYETTRHLMESHPVPIVIVSGSFSVDDADKIFRAMDAGALAIVKKPHGPTHPNYPTEARELVRTVKTMSEVKVVRRRLKNPATKPPPLPEQMAGRSTPAIRLVAMGASTGGPAVYREILSALPKNFGVPIMAVQHMTRGFMEGFVKWLSDATGWPVHLAAHGELLRPGHVYFAPDDQHMLARTDHRIHLSEAPPENGLRPAVSALFRSVAGSYGANAAAVLLTGMGRDGSAELKKLKQIGAVTLVQDRDSSVVYGMPGEALMLDAADLVLSPTKIALLLAQLAPQDQPLTTGAANPAQFRKGTDP